MMCSVFFFKQKTAYEMRISDWSSDVCSSDLLTQIRYIPRPMHPQQIGISSRHGSLLVDEIHQSAGDQTVVDGIEPAGAFRMPATHFMQVRSEERRVGKECVSTCRSRWEP